MIIYISTLFFCCYRSWVFTSAPWFSFCCYFLIDHDYLHQHLDFVFILLSIMVIYTSTLISLLLLFSYRSWLFTPAPWFSFCCYFVIDHGDLHQHIDFVFLFCYRSWLFTPAHWFSFCWYFIIDHDYLHQHLDFLFVVILLSTMAIYTSTLILFFILLSVMVIYTCNFCLYFVIDHDYLHQHLDFLFVVILLSIMAIYTSTLILFLLLFCYRSWFKVLV
jgi:hypothetical protein